MFTFLLNYLLYFEGYVKYMKMDRGNECPSGTEITTSEECSDALKWSLELGLNVVKRTDLVEGTWDHVPYGCSYLSSDKAFHWCKDDQSRFNVPGFISGSYKMICKKGTRISIHPIADAR
jgi:hypothetical protein